MYPVEVKIGITSQDWGMEYDRKEIKNVWNTGDY